MKILGIIPARGGSKGIPNKNIYPINGVPLIIYTVKAALESNIDDVIVSTDSQRIINLLKSYKVKVLKRPKKLSQNNTPTLPVVNHVLNKTKKNYYSTIVTLQPTSPLRDGNHINQALNFFFSKPNADSLVSTVRVPHNMIPNSVMKKENGWLKPYSKKNNKIYLRQNKPKFYARNGAAIYITKSNKLKKYIFGGNCLGFEMNWESSLDIDERKDLELAEFLLKKREMNN